VCVCILTRTLTPHTFSARAIGVINDKGAGATCSRHLEILRHGPHQFARRLPVRVNSAIHTHTHTHTTQRGQLSLVQGGDAKLDEASRHRRYRSRACCMIASALGSAALSLPAGPPPSPAPSWSSWSSKEAHIAPSWASLQEDILPAAEFLTPYSYFTYSGS
jgi:hypothetical protein